MAQMFPRRSATRFDSRGEDRFYARLTEKLEDDYLVWHNVPVGMHRRHPDFMVLHPDRGLLLLEVKDWSIENIRDVSPTTFSVLTQSGLKNFANPLRQARDCVAELVNQLQNDPLLQQSAGTAHAGKLAFPWAYGVVFTNITRDQFEQADLERVIPGHLVICKDEMVPSVDAEDFQQCLWAMFQHSFRCRLTMPQIDQIRGHIFPDLRVASGSGQFGLFAAEQVMPSLMKVMDIQQEQLARSLGSGHRIIHGVAGSGKTMILGYRCLQLAQALRKPVLVLCYNRTLASRLASMLAERGLSEQVHVRNFDAWCYQMLRAYHLPIADSGDDMFQERIATLIEAVEKGHVPRGQYGALLIDEGHDFQPDWYRLVVQMVDPDTNSLLILYDDAQNIYGRSAKLKFSWKSVGVDAVGHTTILRLNYRNTLEVLSVARRFADEILCEQSSDDDSVPRIQPESAGRRGEMPELIRARSSHEQWEMSAKLLLNERSAGHAWSDMAVVCRHLFQIDQVSKALSRAGIPCMPARTPQEKDRLYAVGDTVKVVTMHSAKGLEFPVIVIPGIDAMPGQLHADDIENEAKLLYVAMTRATEKLWLLHVGDSAFTEKVAQSCAEVRQHLAA